MIDFFLLQFVKVPNFIGIIWIDDTNYGFCLADVFGADGNVSAGVYSEFTCYTCSDVLLMDSRPGCVCQKLWSIFGLTLWHHLLISYLSSIIPSKLMLFFTNLFCESCQELGRDCSKWKVITILIGRQNNRQI